MLDGSALQTLGQVNYSWELKERMNKRTKRTKEQVHQRMIPIVFLAIRSTQIEWHLLYELISLTPYDSQFERIYSRILLEPRAWHSTRQSNEKIQKVQELTITAKLIKVFSMEHLGLPGFLDNNNSITGTCCWKQILIL